jgi:hypothetical protein
MYQTVKNALKILSAAFFCCLMLTAWFSGALNAAAAESDNDTEMVPLVPDVPYYLIETDNAALYNFDGGTGAFTAFTSLPKTYFVSLFQDETEDTESAESGAESEYIRVNYHDISGYAKLSDLTAVDFEPVTKHALGNLTVITDTKSVNLRSLPDTSKGGILSEIDNNSSLSYYGKTTGAAVGQNGGNEWYFVNAAEDGTALCGYIYAAYAEAVPIGENVIEPVMVPKIPKTEPPKAGETPPMHPGLTAVFIAALSLPALIIMILLFKRPKRRVKQ